MPKVASAVLINQNAAGMGMCVNVIGTGATPTSKPMNFFWMNISLPWPPWGCWPGNPVLCPWYKKYQEILDRYPYIGSQARGRYLLLECPYLKDIGITAVGEDVLEWCRCELNRILCVSYKHPSMDDIYIKQATPQVREVALFDQIERGDDLIAVRKDGEAGGVVHLQLPGGMDGIVRW